MRFSISLSHHDLARAQRLDQNAVASSGAATASAIDRLVGLARAAEAGGAAAIWVTEDPEGWDAFAILTLLAGRTSTIRLGTGVTNPLLRHPNLIAASVSTLDLVSGGRAFLGIGRGEPAWYRNGLGVPVPPQPLDALSRTVELLREWWVPPYRVQPSVPMPDDVVFPVRNWERSIGPWPGRTGTPSIVIAAAGPKALRLAGEIADGVLFNDLASDEYLGEAIATVRTSAAVAGRDPAALRFTYATRVLLTDDPGPELRRRRSTLALVNALPGMDRQLAGAGFDIPPLVAAIRRILDSEAALARGGGFPDLRRDGRLARAAELVPTALIDRLSVVGPDDHVRRRLAVLAGLGIDEVFVQLPPTELEYDNIGRHIAALHVLS